MQQKPACSGNQTQASHAAFRVPNSGASYHSWTESLRILSFTSHSDFQVGATNILIYRLKNWDTEMLAGPGLMPQAV